MKRFTSHLTMLAAAASIALIAAPAQALLNRTYVSGTGSNAGTCTRSAPCLTFPYAYTQTSAGGEINCIGPGSYGALTIGKTISIICNGTEGGVQTSSGITVNAPTGSIVTLRGLNIDCLGTGLAGIRMINVGVILHIQETHVRGCRLFQGNSIGAGIKITPSSGRAEIFVTDSYVTDSIYGVQAAPTGPAIVTFQMNRTLVENNSIGVQASAYNSTGIGSVKGMIRDSAATGNSGSGFQVYSQASSAVLLLSNATTQGNTVGLTALGVGGVMYVDRSQITQNSTGLSTPTGQIFSYGNNNLIGNTTNGTFSGPVPLN